MHNTMVAGKRGSMATGGGIKNEGIKGKFKKGLIKRRKLHQKRIERLFLGYKSSKYVELLINP